MTRSLILAAAAAALFAVAAPGAAQARMYNPVLNEIAPAKVLPEQAQPENVHYRRYRHSHRGWHPRRHRYRHCWNDRVRVRVPGGYFVWRTHRRCGWRWRY